MHAFIQNHRGTSLSSLIMSIVVFSIALAVSFRLFKGMIDVDQRLQLHNNLLTLQSTVKLAIYSNQSWKFLMMDVQDALESKDPNDPDATQTFCSDDNTKMCRIYKGIKTFSFDSNGSGVFINQSPSNGFDLNGRPCTQFDAYLGNNQCPIKIDLYWKAICPFNERCTTPLTSLDVQFQYKPRDYSIPINPSKYSFQLTQ